MQLGCLAECGFSSIIHCHRSITEGTASCNVISFTLPMPRNEEACSVSHDSVYRERDTGELIKGRRSRSALHEIFLRSFFRSARMHCFAADGLYESEEKRRASSLTARGDVCVRKTPSYHAHRETGSSSCFQGRRAAEQAPRCNVAT